MILCFACFSFLHSSWFITFCTSPFSFSFLFFHSRIYLSSHCRLSMRWRKKYRVLIPIYHQVKCENEKGEIFLRKFCGSGKKLRKFNYKWMSADCDLGNKLFSLHSRWFFFSLVKYLHSDLDFSAKTIIFIQTILYFRRMTEQIKFFILVQREGEKLNNNFHSNFLLLGSREH